MLKHLPDTAKNAPLCVLNNIWVTDNFPTWPQLSLLPVTVFLRCSPATGGRGEMAPRHIPSSRAHSNKIPTATPMFSGSIYLMVVLPVS